MERNKYARAIGLTMDHVEAAGALWKRLQAASGRYNDEWFALKHDGRGLLSPAAITLSRWGDASQTWRHNAGGALLCAGADGGELVRAFTDDRSWVPRPQLAQPARVRAVFGAIHEWEATEAGVSPRAMRYAQDAITLHGGEIAIALVGLGCPLRLLSAPGVHAGEDDWVTTAQNAIRARRRPPGRPPVTRCVQELERSIREHGLTGGDKQALSILVERLADAMERAMQGDEGLPEFGEAAEDFEF